MLPFFEKKDVEIFVYEYENFAFPAHFHPSFEVICAQRGEIRVVIGEKGHILHEGEIGIIFPDRVHSYEIVEGRASKGYLILMGRNVMGEYRRDMEGRIPKSCIISHLPADALNAVEKLRFMQNAPLRIQKAYVRMFLCHLFDKIELCEAETAESGVLYRLVDYMEEHFKENITLGSAASALYVSRYALSRIFSNGLHQSFNDYLNNLRVCYAAELIERGERVSSAALEAGFNNIRTFNRAFLKIYRVSPTKYLQS